MGDIVDDDNIEIIHFVHVYVYFHSKRNNIKHTYSLWYSTYTNKQKRVEHHLLIDWIDTIWPDQTLMVSSTDIKPFEHFAYLQ